MNCIVSYWSYCENRSNPTMFRNQSHTKESFYLQYSGNEYRFSISSRTFKFFEKDSAMRSAKLLKSESDASVLSSFARFGFSIIFPPGLSGAKRILSSILNCSCSLGETFGPIRDAISLLFLTRRLHRLQHFRKFFKQKHKNPSNATPPIPIMMYISSFFSA